MYDHDYNFFGGGGEEGIAASFSDDASVGNEGEGGREGVPSLAAASSSLGNGKHRDPFHVSARGNGFKILFGC